MKSIAKRIYIALIILFLYAPIGILIVLSFNKSKTRAKWGGFTFQWYIELFQNEEILRALFNTLLIAVASPLIATVIGTVACIAMTGMKRRAKSILMGVTNIPMLNADIVTGISLMLLYISLGIKFGMGTILLSCHFQGSISRLAAGHPLRIPDGVYHVVRRFHYHPLYQRRRRGYAFHKNLHRNQKGNQAGDVRTLVAHFCDGSDIAYINQSVSGRQEKDELDFVWRIANGSWKYPPDLWRLS